MPDAAAVAGWWEKTDYRGCRVLVDGEWQSINWNDRTHSFPGEPLPDGLDWGRWCGPADRIPFNMAIWGNQSNPAWVSLRPFSGGAMIDWGAHGPDMAQWGPGMDAGGPEEVWVEGEPFVPQTSTAENPGGRQNGPIKPSVRMRYLNGTTLEFSSGPKFGVVLVGEKGRLTVQRSRFSTTLADDGPRTVPAALDVPEDSTHAHCRNWIECIRDRSEPVAGVEIGQRSMSIGHLANIARWTSQLTGCVGQRLHWDATAERFTNCPEANRFLSRAYRQGYELPDRI